MSQQLRLSQLLALFGDVQVSVQGSLGTVQPRIRVEITEGFPSQVSQTQAESFASGHSPSRASLAGPQRPSSDEDSWSEVTEPVSQQPRAWSDDWVVELEAATTPVLLLALDLQPVEHLTSRLRSYGDWSPLARLAFALRAGYGARLVLAGRRSTLFHVVRQSGVPNRFYIVLRGAPDHRPGWTDSFAVYRTHVAGSGSERFHRESVSHAFASKAEVEAFLIGAGRRWPPQYRSQ